MLGIEREPRAQIAIAIAIARNRIAAETHDIVAHSLAVIVGQADGALMAAALSEHAEHEALTNIAATSRAALGLGLVLSPTMWACSIDRKRSFPLRALNFA